MGPEVRVFFVDCESGSGAFWTRGTARLGFALARKRWGGLAGAVRGGLAWVSDLGAGGLRERLLSPRVDSDHSVQGVFECVLSEGFAVLQGVCRGSGGWFLCMAGLGRDEQEKGIGWMPWRQEAMKDVARCENPGEAASGR